MTDWLEKLSNKQVLTVSQLNNSAKRNLEQQFNTVWVEGEISNFSRPASGHWYFTLKDAQAQIRCAMFRGKNSRLTFTPKNGDAVVVRGSVSLYAPRGDYQLIAENLTETGSGALQRAFDELKLTLQNRGWFDPASKKPLPDRPKQIAVITSETGAVWHDIQTCTERRNPFATLTILPVAVQGDNAANEICKAIETADKDAFDAIILARGGGSLEDLAAFNSEAVATAIHQCATVIVAGVGHETDFSIAEFVSDQRAATPTAAAELLTPDLQQDIQQANQLLTRARNQLGRQLALNQSTLSRLEKRIKHPSASIDEQRIVTDKLCQRLHNATQLQFSRAQEQLRYTAKGLNQSNPSKAISLKQATLERLKNTLHTHHERHHETAQQRLKLAMATLHSVSPMGTLDRGYTITTKDKRVIDSSHKIDAGDSLTLRFYDGERDVIAK